MFNHKVFHLIFLLISNAFSSYKNDLLAVVKSANLKNGQKKVQIQILEEKIFLGSIFMLPHSRQFNYLSCEVFPSENDLIVSHKPNDIF